MPNYSKGKIYKIYNDDLIYIGSTTQTLEQRLKDHLRFYKKYKLVGGCRYTSYDVLDKESYKIELIEDYNCNTKQELLLKEREWIEKTTCVNKTIPIRTENENTKKEKYNNDAEYRQKILKRNSDWLKNNKDSRREYTKLKMRRLRQKWKDETPETD
jgi:hypothetical protein